MGEAKRRGTYEERKAAAEARDGRIREYLPNYKRSFVEPDEFHQIVERCKTPAKPSPTLLYALALAAGMDVPMGRRAK